MLISGPDYLYHVPPRNITHIELKARQSDKMTQNCITSNHTQHTAVLHQESTKSPKGLPSETAVGNLGSFRRLDRGQCTEVAERINSPRAITDAG